jgi:hypothetical protein
MRYVGSPAKRTAKGTWRELDARTMLSRANDAGFLGAARTNLLTGEETRGALALASAAPEHLTKVLGDSLAACMKVFKSAPAAPVEPGVLPKEIREHFESRMTHFSSVMKTLETDRKWHERLMYYVPINLVGHIFPMMVAYYSGQPKFVAQTSAMILKTLFMMAGALHSSTAANRHSAWDHFMERHFLQNFHALVYSFSTFIVGAAWLNDHHGYNIGLTVLVTLVAIAAFMPGPVARKWNATWHDGSINPKLSRAWNNLSAQQKTALRPRLESIKTAAEKARDAITEEKSPFDGKTADGTTGKRLSQYTAKQVNMGSDVLDLVIHEVNNILGIKENKAPNAHFVPKISTTALNAVISGLVAWLYSPDWIALYGTVGDGVFTTAKSAYNACNGNVTKDEQLDEFRTWSGLTVTELVMLAVNKGFGDFIEQAGPQRGAWIGSIAMSIANITLPGPLAWAFTTGSEYLFKRMPDSAQNSPTSRQTGGTSTSRPLPPTAVTTAETP